MITKVIRDEHGIIYEYDSGKRLYIAISDMHFIQSLIDNKELDEFASIIEKYVITDICIVEKPI